MGEAQFTGLFIGSVATLIGIATGIATLIIKPIINLNKSITLLNASIDKLNGENDDLEGRIKKNEKDIGVLHDQVRDHQHEIDHIKERLK